MADANDLEVPALTRSKDAAGFRAMRRLFDRLPVLIASHRAHAATRVQDLRPRLWRGRPLILAGASSIVAGAVSLTQGIYFVLESLDAFDHAAMIRVRTAAAPFAGHLPP